VPVGSASVSPTPPLARSSRRDHPTRPCQQPLTHQPADLIDRQPHAGRPRDRRVGLDRLVTVSQAIIVVIPLLGRSAPETPDTFHSGGWGQGTATATATTGTTSSSPIGSTLRRDRCPLSGRSATVSRSGCCRPVWRHAGGVRPAVGPHGLGGAATDHRARQSPGGRESRPTSGLERVDRSGAWWSPAEKRKRAGKTKVSGGRVLREGAGPKWGAGLEDQVAARRGPGRYRRCDGESAGWSRPDAIRSRKVGAPQGRVLARGQSGRPAGKCHRKQTADGDLSLSRGTGRTGKGETVRQERTSGRGDPVGSANPTRSKAEQGGWAARPAR